MKYLFLVILLILSIFAIFPFFHSGFFPMHDDTQVARVYEMSKALHDGMFPVRWVQDLGYGYGYPIFNFYDPFPYYIGGIFNFAFDSLASTKIMMILGILIAGFSMYLFSKEFWGEKGGVLSALFYLYAPYHALDIFVRGDVAESWAYAFIPLLFYGLWKTYKENKWRYIVISSISYAIIIASHNLTAIMISPFVLVFIIYLIYQTREKIKFRQILNLFLPFLFGVLISAFYWLPAFYEINYTNVLSILTGGSDFRNNFVCINQLWSSPWGYGGSIPGCIDGLSFMIGKYHIILAILLSLVSIYVIYSKKYSKIFEQHREKILIILLSFLGFLFSVFFTLEVSKPVWELVKPMAFLQYPWRFLIMAVFFSSFIAGSAFLFLERFVKDKNIQKLLAIIVCIALVVLSIKFFVPQTYLNKYAKDYTSYYALTWTVSKISDEYMPKDFLKPQNQYQIPDISNLKTPEIQASILERKTQELDLHLNVKNNGSYILPIAFFPGWKAYLDQKSVILYQNNRGMRINLPKGEHSLKITFVQTPVEVLADLLTLAGILCLFAGIIHLRRKYV